LSSQFSLQCTFSFDEDLSQYKCTAEHLLSTFADNHIQNLIGIHDKTYNDKSTKIFYAEHQNCILLPRNLSHFFPHLQHIFVIKSNLQHLMTGDLDGLDNLKELDVSHNPIRHIGHDFFIGHSSILHFRCIECHVNKIDPDAFSPLINVREISLNLNDCIDIKLHRFNTKSFNKSIERVYKKCNERNNHHHVCTTSISERKSGQASVILIFFTTLSAFLTIFLTLLLVRVHGKQQQRCSDVIHLVE
jgi:hypothetical protein